ncbi:MAG: amidase [Candidatus Rokuibacteriota bacterium]|nr:MAG: amidase [Candidatus Rokubacteria bacterium]
MPTQTAPAVAALEAGGYANVGKTNLHEFAYGTTSQNPHFGTVPNPVAPGRAAGGSSGGNAAALALGLADAALGTDSGGSVRIPAACCGVVGFKPTYGLVSLEGCFPLAPSFDHGGPMARDVATCTAMMRALSPGFEPRSLASLEEVEVGRVWLDAADPLVAARVEEAAALFPRLRLIELPFAEGVSPAFMREVADVHRELYAENAELYGEHVATKIERCLAVTDAEYETGLRARAAYRERTLELLDDIDLVVTPTLPCVAPPLANELEQRETLMRFTLPLNIIGAPALAIPCGPAEEGLPASVQVVGKPGADALVLAAGEALSALLQQPIERAAP